MSVTEDGITDLLADYLRDHDIELRTQVSIATPGSRSQPDMQIRSGGRYLGEAKWESNKWKGFAEARDYGNITGVNGTFLITYPEALRDEAAQSRITDENVAESVLSGHEFTCAFLRDGEDTDIETLEIHNIPGWIRENIEQRKEPETDPDQVVSVLRQAAYQLNGELETAPDEDLFRNVLGATPTDEEEQQAARDTAGFLLVNQIAFYRVLSSHQDFPDIDPEQLGSPDQLAEYFDLVLDYDYTPIYSFRIVESLAPQSLTVLRDAIKSIYALGPERIRHDILGKIFHELIPVSARKEVAAYYTKTRAAEILAGLAIDDGEDYVMDPACGSGTLLAASYMTKQSMCQPFGEADHRRFVEEEITGIDVMPFAAHLSCIHLALQAPIYRTDEVNIGIEDSTKLEPGDTISPLSFVLPEGSQQRGIEEYVSGDGPDVEQETVEGGSIAMDAVSGEEMTLRTMDTVIMNPPFTRQESVAGFSDGYKERLRSRFSRRDRRGHIHGKMSYCSYFMFLADKFLDEGGRIAAVIPATVLNKSSDSGVREMLLEEYDIEYVFAREDRPNFSEDTDLREVMVIARKAAEGNNNTTYVSLDGLSVDPSLIQEASESLLNEEPGTIRTVGDRGTATVWRIPDDQIDMHNLFSPFAVHNRELLHLWVDIQDRGEKLTQVQDLDPGLTRGGSSHPWTRGCIAAPDTAVRNSDVFQVDEVDGNDITVKHRHIGETVTVPLQAVESYFLRKPYRTKLNVSELDEYTLVREFSNLERFLSLAEEDEIPDGWEEHVTENSGYTAIPETVDLTAPGTMHPIYFSDTPRVYHRMWVHCNLDETEAKVLALWFDSSIGVLQFLMSRVPGRGGWTKYRKYTQERFVCPDPSELSSEEIDRLETLFDDVSDVDASCLVRQMAQNTAQSDLPAGVTSRLDSHFDGIQDELGAGFEERREVDEAFLDILGFNEEEKDRILNMIYRALLIELLELKEMMD